MDARFFLQCRIERFIAVGRMLLAASSLLAISLDTTEPVRYAPIALNILVGYVIYSLLITLMVWYLNVPLGRVPLITHSFDLVVSSLLIYFAEGPAHPSFLYFFFVLVCATLRWQWRGAVWTAVMALALFLGMGAYAAEIRQDTRFDLDYFIIRSIYLALAALLLAFLGAYVQRLQSEISKLALWSDAVPGDAQGLIRELLQNVAGILGAPRMLMVWEEPEEPWLHLACWSRSAFHWTCEPRDTLAPLVSEPLASADFFCRDTRAAAPTWWYTSALGLQGWQGAALPPAFQRRFAIKAVLALRLPSEVLQGRLFFLNQRELAWDDLRLGAVVARQVAARLDYFYVLERLQQAAATAERIALARDLHDGVLQSLTGAALQLQVVHHLLGEDPQAAKERLLQVQRLIADEQRDLRSFIQGLKLPPLNSPVRASSATVDVEEARQCIERFVPARGLQLTSFNTTEAEFSLACHLEELRGRIERYWGLGVELRLGAIRRQIPQALVCQIYRIVQEALVNAAKHAQASLVRVELSVQDNQVHITVADNGHGLPFHGYYDHAALATMNVGPLMLWERVAFSGGSLAIDSHEKGARLEITLPLSRQGV